MAVRFLHLADTHLGATHRGGGVQAFRAAFHQALAPARRGEVHLVLHGGDVFHRSKPPTRWLAEAAHGLLAAAEGGAEVVVVAGNHERSLIPARLLLAHPRVHLVDRPRRVRLALGGSDLAIFGFPFLRRNARSRFAEALAGTGWPERRAEVNVLLCHQAFAGATVGPADYTFRWGPDVIPRAAVPPEFDYAALGHIHRHQMLAHPDPAGPLLAYPGSTERTSRAERFEDKGVLMGEIRGPMSVEVRFEVLPTHPLSGVQESRPRRAST